MEYFVLDESGNQYGPADMTTLQQWAREGRVQPNTMLRNVQTGDSLLAQTVPGLFPSAGPSSPPPGGYPPNNYANYPRDPQTGYYDDGAKDLQSAWIFSILSLICCGLIFGLLGMQAAKRALAKGNTKAQAPLIISYIGIGLWVVGLILRAAVASRAF